MNVINTTTWVVLADAATAKIYTWHHDKKNLNLVEQFEHPEGREKPTEYLEPTGDHINKEGAPRSACEPHSDLKNDENHRFALHIAQAIKKGLTHKQFNDVIIVAEPHFHGIINQHLGSEIKNKVRQNIMKNYMQLSEKELEEKILI